MTDSTDRIEDVSGRGGLPTDMGDTSAEVKARAKAAAAERAESVADVAQEPGSKKPDPILVVDQVSRSFGGLKAVDVDHLEVQRGIITALIGPNGAGKTTFFNLMTNFDTPDTGTRQFTSDGRSQAGARKEYDLAKFPAHKVANIGMVRTFQLTKSLSKMTVIENMKLGATKQVGENFFLALLPFIWGKQERENEKRAEGLLARFKLDHMRDEFAGTLSGGQRKLLEMARALMVRPELVMLDEPMAGVNPALKQSLLDHVKGLAEEGMTVLFVEHDMDMVQEISDWVVVMAEGQIIAEGPPAAISNNQAVVDAYLGSHHDSALDFGDGAAPVDDVEGSNVEGSNVEGSNVKGDDDAMATDAVHDVDTAADADADEGKA